MVSFLLAGMNVSLLITKSVMPRLLTQKHRHSMNSVRNQSECCPASYWNGVRYLIGIPSGSISESAISGREALDNEALFRHVPSIFARKPHDSRSERYVYVPTIDIVEQLRREGWFPFFAVQAVPRNGNRRGHAKHMLRMRRDDGIDKPAAAEVIIVNSHDGTSAYQMFAGMLRFVCTNSMIAGERFEEVRVSHKGGIEDRIIDGVYTVSRETSRRFWRPPA